MGKYFHKRLYEYYPKRPVRFVDFLANPSVLFQGVLSLCLQSSSCYFFVFWSLYFSKSTANILFNQFCLMVLRFRLGCKKKLVVFRWENSNLDGVVLNIFSAKFQLLYMAATTTSVPDITVNSNCFSNSSSNCFNNRFAVLLNLYLWILYSRSIT